MTPIPTVGVAAWKAGRLDAAPVSPKNAGLRAIALGSSKRASLRLRPPRYRTRADCFWLPSSSGLGRRPLTASPLGSAREINELDMLPAPAFQSYGKYTEKPPTNAGERARLCHSRVMFARGDDPDWLPLVIAVAIAVELRGIDTDTAKRVLCETMSSRKIHVRVVELTTP
jgi:hypothetical protein